MLANHAQVSSLRAFFEQQNNATTPTPPGDRYEGSSIPAGNGATPKPRVRSNFIPVGQTLSSTTPKVEPLIMARPANVATPEETAQENLSNAKSLKKIENFPVVNELKEPVVKEPKKPVVKEPKKSLPTAADVAETKEEVDQTFTEIKVNGSEQSDDLKPTAKTGIVPTNSTVSQPKKPETQLSPRQSSTPKQTELSASPKLAPTPKKVIPAPVAKVISTPKQTSHPSPVPKSPPTPRKTPTPAKSSPAQKKTIGPLSPTKSTSSRRSSSPFLVSPTGVSKLTPQKESPVIKLPSKASPSNTLARSVSTPKSVTAPVKPAPRASISTTVKPAVKGFPTPPAKARTSEKVSSSPAHATRPKSALSNISTPPSRRLVSQPPASSNKPSPRLNRSASLHNLPRTKSVPPERPPVPPVPRATATPGSEQDYSHLPTFMRPTQASSGKVVARPVSSMEKRSRSGSFKI